MKLLMTLVLLSSSLVQAQQLVDKILATANDAIITQSDLDNFRERIKRNRLLDDLFDVDYKKIQNQDKVLLQHLIDRKIVESETKRLNLAPSLERVEEEIANIVQQLGITKSQMIQRLKKDNISYEEYKEFTGKRLETQRLIQREITSKIRISDDELKSFYSNHYKKDSKADVFEYKISHILLNKSPSADSAKQRALSVISALRAGTSFEKLASQYSEDPNFSNGGYLGSFKSGEFLASLENAVRPLNVGETSQLVDLGDKILVLKLLDKKLVESPEFLAQKENIRMHLQQLSFKKQFQFWLSQKRAESNIHINN